MFAARVELRHHCIRFSPTSTHGHTHCSCRCFLRPTVHEEEEKMMNLMASAAERRRLERFSRKSEGPVELFPRPWATAMAPHGRWLLANFHLRKPPPKKFRRSRALIISLTLSRCRHLAPLPLQFPPSSPAFPSLLLSRYARRRRSRRGEEAASAGSPPSLRPEEGLGAEGDRAPHARPLRLPPPAAGRGRSGEWQRRRRPRAAGGASGG